MIGAVAQHFDVLDVRDACNLHSGVLKQSFFGVGFADDASKGRKGLLITGGLLRVDQDRNSKCER